MDADGLPLVGPGVDLTKVTAIHSKRMLAFLNHFIIHTSRFLNKFSCVCEQKLSDLSARIQRLEITMNILEAKLASIPGLENVTVETQASATQGSDAGSSSNLPALPPSETGNPDIPAIESQPEAPPKITVSQDPRYAKYFKMINMGVPKGALVNKLLMEGLNPDLLDTPDAPAPEQGSAEAESSESSFSSGDDFSD